VIGISGASGAQIAVELLKAMKSHQNWETHLIVSPSAEITLQQETVYTVNEVMELADRVYDYRNIAASVSSGSFKTEGMVIIPCSMKTLAGIACGYSDNLLLRAADVTLKEKRKLVLGVRETPLNVIHIRNMLTASEAGATILPLMLTYYNKPKNIIDMTRHIVGKILDTFNLDYSKFSRWGENDEKD
jgi:4-hydroxy-3-polyprenylbenzoate decarboxylase